MPPFLSQRASDNIEQLVGNRLLTALVVKQRQVLKQLVGIVGCRLHGNRTGRMLGRIRVEQDRIQLQSDYTGKQLTQNHVGRRLYDVIESHLPSDFSSGCASPADESEERSSGRYCSRVSTCDAVDLK